MKFTSLLTTVLVAASATFAGHSARATLAFSTGDVFLGFRASGGTGSDTSYVVNLGNVSAFSAPDGTAFSLSTIGDIGADLASVFGTTWYTRSDLSWGIIGTTYDGSPGASDPTIYASRQRNQTTLARSTAWKGRGESSQILTIGQIQEVEGYYGAVGTATTNSSKATLQDGSNISSWKAKTSPSSDFGAFSSIEGNFAQGTSHSILDFYRVDDEPFDIPATYLGNFQISDSGVLTYSAVPEPSTYGLFLGASALLLVIARRRTAERR